MIAVQEYYFIESRMKKIDEYLDILSSLVKKNDDEMKKVQFTFDNLIKKQYQTNIKLEYYYNQVKKYEKYLKKKSLNLNNEILKYLEEKIELRNEII
jgi:hypothetical protein